MNKLCYVMLCYFSKPMKFCAEKPNFPRTYALRAENPDAEYPDAEYPDAEYPDAESESHRLNNSVPQKKSLQKLTIVSSSMYNRV